MGGFVEGRRLRQHQIYGLGAGWARDGLGLGTVWA